MNQKIVSKFSTRAVGGRCHQGRVSGVDCRTVERNFPTPREASRADLVGEYVGATAMKAGWERARAWRWVFVSLFLVFMCSFLFFVFWFSFLFCVFVLFFSFFSCLFLCLSVFPESMAKGSSAGFT